MVDHRGLELFPIVTVNACPVAVVTRASTKAADLINDDDLDLSSLEVELERPGPVGSPSSTSNILQLDWDRLTFIEAQKQEFDFELGDTADLTKPRFCVMKGLLYRISRPSTHDLNKTSRVEQIVVPSQFRESVLKLSHDDSFSGHFGVFKTFKRLAKCFWWPGLKSSVKQFVSNCEVCQVMGKPNQVIPKAPLNPIPAIGEPFVELVIDVVGPLPRTKTGFTHLLTIMDRASRFPEAFPMKKITSNAVFEKLVEFFSRYGLPRKIQTDCGTNFTSKVFRGKCAELAIQCTTSVPYHPESQGVVERFHQTLKSVLKKYCYEQGEDWEKGLPFALFAIRNHPNASTGVAPFELIYGHKVRGPLEIFHELLSSGQKEELNVMKFVENLRKKLAIAWKFARENLASSQVIMKSNFDKKTKVRSFEPGELVLVLSTYSDNFLEPRYKGPWKVLRKLSEVNYEIEAPGTKRKCRVFHINRLKSYISCGRDPLAIVCEPVSVEVESPEDNFEDLVGQVSSDALFNNIQNLEVLKRELDHLEVTQKRDIINLICFFPEIFRSSPGRTRLLQHDVDVGSASPVKQSPYRLNPVKRDIVEEEIKYMLKHDLIQPSISPWSSPIVLVKKSDGKYRMCVDYRKVNASTKNDSFPLPRIDDCLDQIGSAKFITKLDLLKGYWQVPLSDRAREISAFVTPFGLYECKVMPFGMKNAACTFQRLMNRVICGLKGTEIYIDDLVVHSNDWQTHIVRLRKVFEALRDAGLVVNLGKCEFGKAKVCYLGHEVGLGQVAPKQANLDAILNLKRPSNVREVRRVLGMTGYYRRFVRNFSDIAQPLTKLLEKGQKFAWSPQCEESFIKLKLVLISNPILISPDFQKPFIIAVDASDVGIGGVLFQRNGAGEVLPVSYFSRKLLAAERRYSTIEKEALALVRTLLHFKPYVTNFSFPIEIWTDHNPLLFIERMKGSN
ncbi:uncharacterized protein [Palaemon carinicauda]|uniref:uncharacterized protein n=1 Tax=Palaemon carinicauda TaxID=392227 RepID=UPI0035B5F37C